MNIVEAKCPGCNKVLRIPVAWLDQPMRCKHCGAVSQGRVKTPPASQPTAPVAPLISGGSSAAPTAIPLPNGKGSPHAPMAIPLPAKAGRGFGQIAALFLFILAGVGGLGGLVWWSLQMPVESSGTTEVASVNPVATGFANTKTAQPATKPSPSAEGSRPTGGGPTSPSTPNTSLPTSPRNPPSTSRTPTTQETTRPTQPRPTTMPTPPATNPGTGVRPPDPMAPVVTQGPVFPRRLLAISINNYAYASSVPTTDVRPVVAELARKFNIADSQVVELGDTAAQPKPPRKGIIMATLTRFLDSCRSQDRIIILFVGHAVEIKDQAYLVPIEGDLLSEESLIPLSWVYDQMTRSKARQKVLMLDVCRLNPQRDVDMPGGGPMGTKLDAMLASPPVGVQVWAPCSAGQSSYEVGNSSVFLSQVLRGLQQLSQIHPTPQRPEDPLPLGNLAEFVRVQTQDAVKKAYENAEQSPRLTVLELDAGAPYDPREPLPAPLDIALPPNDGMATAAQIRAILDEVEAPPVRPNRAGANSLRLDMLPPLPLARLEAYKADNEKTPFRMAIENARKVLNEQLSKRLREEFQIDFNGRTLPEAKFKDMVLEEQKRAGALFQELSDAHEELKKAGEERDKEPSKRWQANYDYMLARLEIQLAYLYEYQTLLGQMRKELPPRDPAKENGWRLVAKEKLETTEREFKAMLADARKNLDKLAKEHPGTPWEMLARRDRAMFQGLKWQATNVGGGPRRPPR
ncbi:MAG: caspase family protein [Gemmataceae bacterium]|nr:caspase family protein [Gemmataceae bacterium]MDW8264324.1 caspase family protein [Gemmataceae bacterium]